MESTQPILRCRYSYDPLDRLISQLQPDVPAHQRFYCKIRLATEIQGAIGFSVFQNNDLLLAQHKNQGGAVESTLLATDLQRSVLHTLTAEQPQHPIAYSPYGHRQTESGLTSLLGFNGERLDPVTGNYLLGNGYRAFDPALMRFNSPDSLSPFGEGGLNSYSYCVGNPTNFTDPSGHFPLTKLFGRFWRNVVKKNKADIISMQPNKFSNPLPGQYEYLGYHGSSSAHIASLENGLDTRFMNSRHGQHYGPGFYATKNLETATSWSKSAASGNDSPVVFDVFVRRPKAVTRTRKDLQHNFPVGIKEAGSSENFVIHPLRYNDVVVKARDFRTNSKKDSLFFRKSESEYSRTTVTKLRTQ